MKRFVVSVLCIIMMAIALTGCGNKDMWDTNYTYDKAIIKLQDISLELDIKQWTDYEDGDQIQIIDDDGNVYLTSSVNVILINEN